MGCQALTWPQKRGSAVRPFERAEGSDFQIEDRVSRQTRCVSRSHFLAARELRKGVWGSLFKAGQAAAEDELDLVGRTVALFGDEDVGHVALFGRGVEIEEIWAVDEHDDVGVLFDRTGLAEVGELRAALVALRSAGELAEDEDGDLQLLGEALESAGYAGDLFLAGIKTAASGDQLQIIDDQESKALVALEATCLSADFEDAGGAGVIDPERRRGDLAERFGHAPPVLAAEVAGTEFVRVDLSDGSNEALEKRFLGHFEAEHSDRKAATDADIFGEIQRQGRFSL